MSVLLTLMWKTCPPLPFWSSKVREGPDFGCFCVSAVARLPQSVCKSIQSKKSLTEGWETSPRLSLKIHDGEAKMSVSVCNVSSCLQYILYLLLKCSNGVHARSEVAEVALLICAWCIWLRVQAYLW